MVDVQVPAVAPVHLDTAALEAGLDAIRNAPQDNGTLELIVRRPEIDARELLEEAELSTADGVHAAQHHQRSAVPARRR
jgi:hypothetical protein